VKVWVKRDMKNLVNPKEIRRLNGDITGIERVVPKVNGHRPNKKI